tara:strand:- start:197 stop:1105 length:909 start_codon:yes stop_codon:yes gene_type:complete
MNTNLKTDGELFGLNKYFIEFSKLIHKNKIPKVIMFSGKKGIGKYTLAHHLLSYYLDRSNYNDNEFKINDNNIYYKSPNEIMYPNIVYLSGNEKVSIENIRKLRSDLQKTTIDNGVRFIILDDVEKFNLNSSNALLKIIEEPTVFNYFILINNKTKEVLETIKSRSIEFKIFLKDLDRKKIIEKLISNNDIDSKIDYKNSHITPGDYLEFNNICLESNLSVDTDLLNNVEKLFKLYKGKRDLKYLRFSIFLINYHYFIQHKKNKTNEDVYLKRSSIIKKINYMSDFNLNSNNIFNDIESIMK